jgi:RNA polymerase sigma factor (sigma-70 family)
VSAPTELERRIAEQRAEVLRFIERRAGGALIRMESPEDLTQDVLARALRNTASFEWRDEASFRAWLFEVARNHIEDRRDYWSALKRAGTQVLRLGGVGEGAGERIEVSDLAGSVTGPSTFAARREQLAVAAKALSLLPPRDRELIEGLTQGLSASEHARLLETTVPAVEGARKRALERLRKTFKLVLGQRG